MKVFVFAFAVLATSAYAENLDWTNAKPIEYYREAWANKPAELQPPSEFFDSYRGQRIVGGSIAQPHQFPYQASLLIHMPLLGGWVICGGSVLSSDFVLTAAHCIEDASEGTVILGAHNRLVVTEPNQVRVNVGAAAFRLHPEWDPSLIRNDIGLIRIPTVTLNAFIQAVRLPTGGELSSDFAGELGVVSGWGVWSDDVGTASDVLRYVYDNVMTNTLCTVRFPGVIQASNICVTGTNGRGACSGDSGGPLTVQRGGESVVIGVVSFGLALGCELAWPSVFARTTFFDTWLRNTMNNW